MQPKRSSCVSRVRVLALLSLGLGLVVLGGFLPVVWPAFYQKIITEALAMTPESKTYGVWLNNPVPIHIDFFFFNWTNHEALEWEGDMHVPEFQELGPYRFREEVERVNVTWNDNGTLTYQQARWWYFDEEHTNGSLDDIITTLNLISLTAANTMKESNIFLKTGASTALGMTHQKVHITRSIRELLFEGYSDQLINIASTLPYFSNVKVPMDKFAWFYKRNGTTFMDGVFNMNTGQRDISRMGTVETWNYDNRTDFFPDECGQVVGTSGQLFPPGQSRDRRVKIFSPDLCRSIGFDYSEDTLFDGILGYKYHGSSSMLDNGTTFPENACYCNGECVPAGIVNLTSCRFGAPAFASYPHFYLADPFFTESIRGLKPDKEKHQFYITLEPTTGIPLDVAGRFQINLLLQPVPGISLYNNVPTVFFPMIWFQERATMTPDLVFQLKVLLLMRYLGIFIGVVTAFAGCLLIGYACFIRVRKNSVRTMHMTKEMDESNLYVAVLDSPNNDKVTSNQYIIMKPRSKANNSANL